MEKVKLTGEILASCPGARKKDKWSYILPAGPESEFLFHFAPAKGNYWVEYVNNDYILSLPTEIKYVDELQNFWLGVMGKELEALN